MEFEICWVDMCRGCMDVGGDLVSLYPDDEPSSESDLLAKLMNITSVEISKIDGLPTKLCHKCIIKTEEFFKFKQLVQNTDKNLKQMFNQQFISTDFQNDSDHLVSNDEYILFKEESNASLESIHLNANDDSSGYDETQITEIESVESKYKIVTDTNKIPNTLILKNNNVTTNVDARLEDMQFVVTNDINVLNFHNSHLAKLHNQKIESDKISGENDNNDVGTSDNNVSNTIGSVDGIFNDNASDSDIGEQTQDNTVGSLNDTITKIKEIKKGNKIINFQCTLCLENYQQLFQALNHIVNLHVPQKGPYYCVVCEKDCSSMKELKIHITKHNGESPYTCFICDKAYTKRRYLKRHMGCHTDFPRHRCAKCGTRFKVKSELDEHVSSHTNGTPFSCNQCDRKFNFKANYKRHLITHLDPQGCHLPKFPCTICKKRFFNNRNLDTHMRVHTGEKPFKCKICDKAFSQRGNLINHSRIHANSRKFTCEVCGKSFNQKATLKEHGILHTGTKPYICSICGDAFTFSSALRRHMWSHSDTKPFECEVCGIKFVGKYDLKRHMNIHSNARGQRRKKKVHESTLVNKSDANIALESSQANTILVEEILLCDDSMQIIPQNSAKKDNLGTIFQLI